MTRSARIAFGAAILIAAPVNHAIGDEGDVAVEAYATHGLRHRVMTELARFDRPQDPSA